MRVDEYLPGGSIILNVTLGPLDALGEIALLLRRQQGHLADVPQVHPHGVADRDALDGIEAILAVIERAAATRRPVRPGGRMSGSVPVIALDNADALILQILEDVLDIRRVGVLEQIPEGLGHLGLGDHALLAPSGDERLHLLACPD